MRAIVKPISKGSQLPINSGGTTKLGDITITPGSYVVFAKMDILADAGSNGLAHVQVQLTFKDPQGHIVEDETTHQWANPPTSNHTSETITLNIGVRFEPTIGSLGTGGQLRSVELVAFANRNGVFRAANLVMTAIGVDELVDDLVI
jgi:hypothetical protein